MSHDENKVLHPGIGYHPIYSEVTGRVAEIADRLHDTPRNIYFYIDQAKKIGKQFKRDNE